MPVLQSSEEAQETSVFTQDPLCPMSRVTVSLWLLPEPHHPGQPIYHPHCPLLSGHADFLAAEESLGLCHLASFRLVQVVSQVWKDWKMRRII